MGIKFDPQPGTKPTQTQIAHRLIKLRRGQSEKKKNLQKMKIKLLGC